MNAEERESLYDTLVEKLSDDFVTYKQYKHRGICSYGDYSTEEAREKGKCCYPYIGHIHASNQLHTLPKHPNCDCYYEDVKTMELGTISQKQPSPDVWLKLYGKLPDYYITKEEAEEKYGWVQGKNTIAGKAPGKMIGGDPYDNKDNILPVKEGRIWYECDIDYESGGRNSLRLYYSNDGLMFYSTNHLDEKEPIVYWIK